MRFYLTVISLFVAFSLASQESTNIIRSSLRADIKKDDAIEVDLQFLISANQDTIVDLKALSFENSSISNLKCFLNEIEIAIEFQKTKKIFSGRLKLEEGEDQVLQFIYQLPLVSLDTKLVLPLIYPELPTVDPEQELFHGWLRIYRPLEVFEAFPTAGWQVKPESVFADHDLLLQAIPSIITLQLGEGDKPFFSVMRLVDGFVILLLIGLMVAGWKKIRQI